MTFTWGITGVCMAGWHHHWGSSTWLSSWVGFPNIYSRGHSFAQNQNWNVLTNVSKIPQHKCGISGSRGGEYKNKSLLGYCAVLSRSRPTFQRWVLPPHHPDNGGSTHPWNVGLQQDYTVLYPTSLSSSYLSYSYIYDNGFLFLASRQSSLIPAFVS
jgi:hypothetical protein